MRQSRQISPREAALYAAYEDIIFEMALTRVQAEEDTRLSNAPMDEDALAECEQFFQDTQDSTLRIIERECRKRSIRRFGVHTLPRIGVALACVTLVFFVALTVAVAAVPPVRDSLLQFISRMDTRYSEFIFSDQSRERLTPPDTWKGEYFPTYCPAGFQIDYIDENQARVIFVNPATDEWWSFHELNEAFKSRIDTEGAQTIDFEVGGFPAILSVEGDITRLVWSTDSRSFTIRGNASIATIEQIAQSFEIITN